jgi:predicted regulator of Ras-like GTPase activity (Roadblock/LC7/MglB family)
VDEVQEICHRTLNLSNALAVMLLDEDGQSIAGAGDVARLAATIASLNPRGDLADLLSDGAAGCAELAKRIDGGISLHLSMVGRWILAVLFDSSSSLGLVRLRAKKASEELEREFRRR